MNSNADFSRISGSTQLYFVLGDPVVQVKAPKLFNHLFAQAGIDAVLLPAHVPAAALESFIDAALSLHNVGGLWVTIPHKTTAAALCARLSEAAQVAGAVNALKRGADGALEGALFDGSGFVAALAAQGVALQGRRVWLSGAGGAGLALAAALLQEPLAELTVHDTDAARADSLVARLAPLARFALRRAAGSDIARHDLVINATPLGLAPTDALPFDPAALQAGTVVADILMTAEPTSLLRASRVRGLAAHSGHEMMLQQCLDYLAFFGHQRLAAKLRATNGLSDLRRLIGAPPL